MTWKKKKKKLKEIMMMMMNDKKEKKTSPSKIACTRITRKKWEKHSQRKIRKEHKVKKGKRK